MKRACAQAFIKKDENLLCEFHMIIKNQLSTYEINIYIV
jgi:hypothetical protein